MHCSYRYLAVLWPQIVTQETCEDYLNVESIVNIHIKIHIYVILVTNWTIT